MMNFTTLADFEPEVRKLITDRMKLRFEQKMEMRRQRQRFIKYHKYMPYSEWDRLEPVRKQTRKEFEYWNQDMIDAGMDPSTIHAVYNWIENKLDYKIEKQWKVQHNED